MAEQKVYITVIDSYMGRYQWFVRTTKRLDRGESVEPFKRFRSRAAALAAAKQWINDWFGDVEFEVLEK